MADETEEPLVAKEASASDEVIESLKYEADGGDRIANVELADLFYHGLRNTPINVEAAEGFYQKAAIMGDAKAEIQIAKMKVLGQSKLVSNETLMEILNKQNNVSEAVALKAHVFHDGVVKSAKRFGVV